MTSVTRSSSISYGSLMSGKMIGVNSESFSASNLGSEPVRRGGLDKEPSLSSPCGVPSAGLIDVRNDQKKKNLKNNLHVQEMEVDFLPSKSIDIGHLPHTHMFYIHLGSDLRKRTCTEKKDTKNQKNDKEKKHKKWRTHFTHDQLCWHNSKEKNMGRSNVGNVV